MPLTALLRKLLLGSSPEQATFARRGFRPAQPDAQQRLEQAGQVFLWGYHEALDLPSPKELCGKLNQQQRELQGFAFEGAAMALALLDGLPGRSGRFQEFLAEDDGSRHRYMLHVGAGWAVARNPWWRRNVDAWLAAHDPLLGWLAVDGYGFHEGYFHTARSIQKCERPRRLSNYALQAFDQGLGRSLWFFGGADASYIAEIIRAFPADRHADLFSGLGLASAYAGGAARSEIEHLQDVGQRYTGQLAQGAAFAAKTRQRAGNPTEHTGIACEVLCGMSADQAADLTDDCLAEVLGEPSGDQSGEPVQPAYEAWRLRIQQQFASEEICHA